MFEEIEQQIYAATGNPCFFNPSDFPWVRDVESDWKEMRRELDRLMVAIDALPGFEEIQNEQSHITDDRRWKIFPLFAYGTWMERNALRCPITARALRKIPSLQAAMFSIMQAHKELPPHRGVYGGVLRYHLGLKVPQPPGQCGIRVGKEVAYWDEGKSMIFDDAHDHAAWNHSSEDRAVLFVDFTRPLPAPLAQLNEAVLGQIRTSSLMADAVARWNEWEARHGSELDRLLATTA